MKESFASRKKILYVITKANWGGAQKYVYTLACAAHDLGYDVSVVYGEPGLLVEKLERKDIRTIRAKGMRNEASFSALRRARVLLYNIIKEEKPDIVHLNSSLASAAGAKAAQQAGVPKIIYTAHGWAFNESRPLWQRAVIRLFVWTTIVRAYTTICVSNAIYRDVYVWPFVRNRLTVIKNGVESATILPKEDARKHLATNAQGSYWIGMISEFHPTKRIQDAIEAMALIIKSHPEVALVVLGGEGPERPRLEKLVRERGLEKNVHLIGFVEDAPKYLSAFDLFVHASQSEAIGLVILEAGMAGLPTVATRVGGIPEVIESGVHGLLVPVHSPQKLAQAMLQIIENPKEAQCLGSSLKKRVENEFSTERMVQETLALY